MNLPVKHLVSPVFFYEKIMALRVVLQKDEPYQSVVLERDGIQIGLAQNGGDPSQQGCFFEVDDVEAAFAELISNGLQKDTTDFDNEQNGTTYWKVF